MYDLLALYAEPLRIGEPLVCIDEKSLQLLSHSRAPLPMASHTPTKVDYEYLRKGTTNLFVAIEPKAGKRTVAVTEHRGKTDFVAFISGKGDPIHLRLGRVEGDGNSPRRGYQPHFVGRSAKECESDMEQTLNGHACGGLVQVAGTYYDSNFPYASKPVEQVPGMPPVCQALQGRSTPYSGAGPTSGSRQRPDISLPMEDGLLCAGVLSTGTRSGSLHRMVGTRTAAPTAAQGAANEAYPERAAPSDDSAMGNELYDPYVRSEASGT